MIRALTWGVLSVLLVAGCSRSVPDPDTSKELVVVTRYEPGAYFLDSDNVTTGFNYDLVEAFAAEQGWLVRWQQSNSYADLFKLAKSGKAHLVAANLVSDSLPEQGLRQSPVLYLTRVVVVTRQSVRRIDNLADLAKLRLVVMTETGHQSLLEAAQRKYPKLKWTALEGVFPEDLFARLDEAQFDGVIVNEKDFDLARQQYPSLRIAYVLANEKAITWALPQSASGKLAARLNQFFIQSRRNDLLKNTYERYYGHIKRLESGDVEGIHKRRLSVLPRFRHLFHQAQDETAIDWRLLSAIGYQESKWDPYAISPTGVRGLMMLTGPTADRMGVTNRLDARQSIMAGARYLVLLKDTLPDRIPEPDRTWLALAAYNQGQGHLEDARRIAQAKGMNPDSWADVKQTLPLLARGGYKGVTKYGYSRGGEAVIFVESIRNYYDILRLLEKEHKPLLFGNAGQRNTLALN